ncbi:D-alanyl-D-alanine carboxypeptidase family protein [Sphingomonas oligophenolica]|nr:D-alanyl-D-alanine carboxypeptidase family protein [Sphingomonas oligophenolica]
MFFIGAGIVVLATPSSGNVPTFDTAARFAIMEDLSSGLILYQKNADTPMPPASLAKMMTVYVAFDMIKKGQLKPDDVMTVRPETWQKWHGQGSTMFLSAGERVSVRDLIYGIITLSGNDACVVLAEGIAGTEPAFVSLMNDRASRLGLTGSHFGTSNGWPDNDATYVTARDLAKLASSTIVTFPSLYKQYYSKPNFTWGATAAGAAITQANRDPLLGRVSGADGLKTGHTEEAGYGFTGSADQQGRRLVMVLAGMNSWNERVSDSVNFMEWGFRAWTRKMVVKQAKEVGYAQVQLGDKQSVGLVAPRDLSVTVPAGSEPVLNAKIVYDGPLKAPIVAGAHVADLVVSTGFTPPQVLPLVAEANVGTAGFFDRVKAGFLSMFAG